MKILRNLKSDGVKEMPVIRRLPYASLRIRLILLVLLAIIPALVIFFYNATILYQREADRVEMDVLILTRLVASQEEQLIEGARQLLVALAQLSAVRSGNSEICNARLSELLRLYQRYSAFGVATADGAVVCSTTPLDRPYNVAHRAWFQRAIETRNFSVGDYQIGQISGEDIVVFSYPIIDRADQIQGVIFAVTQLAKLNQLASEVPLSDGAVLTIIDRNGTILTHYPNPEEWVGRTLPDAPLIKLILGYGEGRAEVAGLDGNVRLYAFTPLNSTVETGLYLTAGIPKDIAFAEVEAIWTRNLIWLEIIGLLALLAAWFGSDYFILRQVRALVHASHRLRRDLSARTGLSHNEGELGRLAQAFDQMAASLEQVEEELQLSNAELEQRVMERTAELQMINEQLEREILERKQVEETLRESEVRFRTVFEGAAIGIALANLEGKIIATNPAFQKMLGYTGEEMLKLSLADFTHPADLKSTQELFQTVVTGQQDHYQLEKRYRRKDGATVWGNLSVSLIRSIQGDPHFTIGMITDITARKQMEAELSEVRRRLAESREAERLHLAQELHDGPIQDLYGVSYRLNGLWDGLQDEVSRGQLVAAQATLQRLIQELRTLCGELRPPTLTPFGLEKAIRSHAEQFQETHPELEVALDLMPDGQILSEQVRLALFRIYQEALNNIIRHAQARHIWIRLRLNEKDVVLEIRDDGRGFEVPKRRVELARQGHLGLIGATERSEAIGGELRILSTPGQGTLIEITTPYSSEQELIYAKG